MGYRLDIDKEAIKRWPEEMVGYVKDSVFVALKNVSKDPRHRYKISTKDKFFILDKNVDYLVHSHTTLDNEPSDLDLKSQRSSGIKFLIVGTDGKSTTKIKEVS